LERINPYFTKLGWEVHILLKIILVSAALPITYSKPLVATQINNDKYIIEHTTDGRHFSFIGEIAGDGNNTSEKHYDYTHDNPSIGINYYRIKQVDYDGKYSFSDVASLAYDGDGREIAIYPNPVSDGVTIFTPNNASLTIIDIYGRNIQANTFIEGENSIDIKELTSGFYIFAFENGDRYKILKE